MLLLDCHCWMMLMVNNCWTLANKSDIAAIPLLELDELLVHAQCHCWQLSSFQRRWWVTSPHHCPWTNPCFHSVKETMKNMQQCHIQMFARSIFKFIPIAAADSLGWLLRRVLESRLTWWSGEVMMRWGWIMFPCRMSPQASELRASQLRQQHRPYQRQSRQLTIEWQEISPCLFHNQCCALDLDAVLIMLPSTSIWSTHIMVVVVIRSSWICSSLNGRDICHQGFENSSLSILAHEKASLACGQLIMPEGYTLRCWDTLPSLPSASSLSFNCADLMPKPCGWGGHSTLLEAFWISRFESEKCLWRRCTGI